VKVEELLATKMRCLLQRRHIADLFDLVYATLVSQELEVDRGQLLSTFFRITIFGSSPGVAKGLFVDLPLEALGRFWDAHIACPKTSWFTFDTARKRFLAFIDRLIPGAVNRERSPVLFAAALRNPIMQAGETLTLLRLGYAGVVRLVEPYSIMFKTRRDGVAREYLYAYDRTGGRTSGPGIKAFVPDRVTSIDNTDESFEPRFDVDLRKAGGAEMSGCFKSRGRAANAYSPWQQVYEVECPCCLRRFRRKRFNTKLRPHQDRYGNPCHGRVGYPV